MPSVLEGRPRVEAGAGAPGADDLRGTVACEHAEPCGGCPLIHLPYAEQLALKRGRVVQAISRHPGLELVYTEPVSPAFPTTGYRTRAKLVVGPGGKIGLFGRGGGHHIVDIPGCQVLSPRVHAFVGRMRDHIQRSEIRKGVLSAVGSHPGGALRAVDVREVDGEDRRGLLVTWVFERARAPPKDLLVREAHEVLRLDRDVVGIAANYHDGVSPQILGPETLPLVGALWAEDRVGESSVVATFGSFVQAHRAQAGKIHALIANALGLRAQAALGRRARVLDLFGGSGAIALALATNGADVLLVESFAPAAESARRAASAKNLPVEAIGGDVATALQSLVANRERWHAVVVNPPRRGITPLARELIARLDTDTLVYVSCEPDRLARDLDHFSRLGFAPLRLEPLDMIPLTEEVETVAILRRTPPPPARILFEDDALIIADKAPHEPTLPQGGYVQSLTARVRQIPGAAEATAVQRLDVGTSGAVAFAKNPADVDVWSEHLAKSARRVFVVAARGVMATKGSITRELGGGGSARTRYRRLAVAAGHSILRVVPEEERPHQVRRHFAAIGHPVLGDDRYGHAPSNRYFEEKHGLDRPFLHCVRLEVTHLATARRMSVDAPLPGDLRAVLERTSGPGTLRFLDQKHALGGPMSSVPPPPDARHSTGSGVDLDARPTLPHDARLGPESGDDDDFGRQSGGPT